MATAEQITEFRETVQQPENTAPYTDAYLSALIDTYGLDAAAGKVWRAKAAQVATLVDISEGGSSRKMGDLFDNYSAIAATYEDKVTTVVTTSTRASRTREIERS